MHDPFYYYYYYYYYYSLIGVVTRISGCRRLLILVTVHDCWYSLKFSGVERCNKMVQSDQSNEARRGLEQA